MYQLDVNLIDSWYVLSFQEELKIVRLKYSLLLEEELNNREEELMDKLEFKKEMKVCMIILL